MRHGPDNTTRSRSRDRGDGIVQPVSEETDQLSRRLHHHRPPAARPGDIAGDVRIRCCMARKAVRRLTPEEAAYLAGLIDGEGTITLTRRHANERRQLVLSISSTERALVEWSLTSIGVGKITGKRTSSAAHAPGLTYTVSNQQAMNVLRQVVDYLRSYNQLRARLALARYDDLTPRNGKYSDEQDAERRRFEDEFLSIRAREAPKG